MIKHKFSVTQCSNHPQRWNVYFNNSLLYNMQSIHRLLEKHQYQVIASTPNILVVRSKEARLTWHNEGFVQVDMYKQASCDAKDIEHLIKDILDVNTIYSTGESIG